MNKEQIENTFNEKQIIKEFKRKRETSKSNIPKYAKNTLNYIATNFQATRPKNVGQMSEIIPAFIKMFLEENNKSPKEKDWEEFYLKNYPEKYELGLEIMKNNYQKVINDIMKIDEKMIEEWYYDFIINKNFNGFIFEEDIKNDLLKKGYEIKKSTPEEESRNIDFWIKEKNEDDFKIKVNIKPSTFDSSHFLKINKDIKIINYKKNGNDLEYWFK